MKYYAFTATKAQGKHWGARTAPYFRLPIFDFGLRPMKNPGTFENMFIIFSA